MGILWSSENKTKLKDAFINFETAQPETDEEKELNSEICGVLEKAKTLLEIIRNYKGSEELIRAAISTPSKQTEGAAWDGLLPGVANLKSFFTYSDELAAVSTKIVACLAKAPMGETGYPELSEYMAKQFCDVVSFAFEFDAIKMSNPSIQNDLSFYKRRIYVMGDVGELAVDNELAARLSQFFAVATPMLTALCNSIQVLVNKSEYKLEKTLETMIEVTLRMLENAETESKFESPDDMIQYIMRVMTGLIIIYDHVNKAGAFHKKSMVDIKAAITVLKKKDDTSPLLLALKFSSKHFGDETTPAKITQMLA